MDVFLGRLIDGNRNRSMDSTNMKFTDISAFPLISHSQSVFENDHTSHIFRFFFIGKSSCIFIHYDSRHMI